MLSIAQKIIYGTKEEVEQALFYVRDLNHIDEFGFTPLIETAIVDDIDKAKLLLSHDADVNMKDLVGGTALHWAVENNNLKLCRLLLEKGADPNGYTHASEAPMVKALLRHQEPLKKLLSKYGANLAFAQDFIFTKLLGHRYSLRGYVDIVDVNNQFTEVSFEGFFLEFSIGLIQHSLEEYKHHYAAKKIRPHFKSLERIIQSLKIASELVKYQQYRTDINRITKRIDTLIQKNPLLIIPIACEGHAMILLKYKNILIKCDRRKSDPFLNGIMAFKIGKPSKFNLSLVKFLLYEKKAASFFEKDLPKLVGLKQIGRLMIEPQMSGNCSWSNVEASLPAALLLLEKENHLEGAVDYDIEIIKIFRHWRDWDRGRALHFFMHEFKGAPPTRKASIAAVLGAIFFQRLDSRKESDLKIARKILPILKTPGYEYILDNYLKFYLYQKKTPAGRHLKELIEHTEESV